MSKNTVVRGFQNVFEDMKCICLRAKFRAHNLKCQAMMLFQMLFAGSRVCHLFTHCGLFLDSVTRFTVPITKCRFGAKCEREKGYNPFSIIIHLYFPFNLTWFGDMHFQRFKLNIGWQFQTVTNPSSS